MNRPTSRSPAQAVIKATDAQPTLGITNQMRALPTRPSAGISSIVTIGIPQNRAPVILYRGTSNSRAKGKKCSPTIMRSSGAMSAQRWVITHARVTPVKARPSAATIAPNRRQNRRPSDGRGCVASRTWNTARSIAMLMTINTTATTDIVSSSAVATGDRTTSNETAAKAVLLATSQRLPPAKPRLRRRPINNPAFFVAKGVERHVGILTPHSRKPGVPARFSSNNWIAPPIRRSRNKLRRYAALSDLTTDTFTR
jgi:hypothetical protein